MCLSTPKESTSTTAQCSSSRNENGATTNMQHSSTTISSNTTVTDAVCSSSCITTGPANCNNNNNNNINVTDISSSINQRKKNASDATTETQDLDDSISFGYKEENAVYKERNVVDNVETVDNKSPSEGDDIDDKKFIAEIRWADLMAQIFMHSGALYGVFLMLTAAKFYTFLWVVVLFFSSGIGITAGAHRLWSHKSYSASVPLRLLLMFLFTIAGQRDAYTWALDHRIHHKFSETDADPHNAKRGFFFAHVAWLFLTPHPKVVEKRRIIDISDLENDRIVMFQRKWYIPLFTLCSIVMPVSVPWYFWDESIWTAFWTCFNMRFTSTLNVAFFVNSLAHMWGRKPYDKNISPVESPIVSLMALGEGWHNYHHVFPWDYKTGEFGSYSLNLTTGFIDFCAKLGLASGRKSVSSDMIARRAAKCGDGTRFLTDEYAHKDQLWGYGDRDISKEDAIELEKMKD